MPSRLLMSALLCLQGRFLMPGVLCLLVASIAWAALAKPERRPPIIDMHLHTAMLAPAHDPSAAQCGPAAASQGNGDRKMPACAASALSATTEAAMRQRMLKQLQHYNVVGVLNVAQAESMSTWRVAAPGRIIPGTLPLDPLHINPATVARVKAVQAAGTLAVLGDVGTQHGGIALDDPRMEAFWQLAETLEMPVGMHIGRGATDHRHAASTDSPRAITRVLTRHPRLRVYLMQAGDPMLEDLLAVLETHPQLYVDVGQLAYTQSRPAFYRDLQAMVDAGFGDRLMFGSGNRVWPESIGRAIDIVDDAPFLDARQKRDIFYNNAARFLRLSPQQRAQHQAS